MGINAFRGTQVRDVLPVRRVPWVRDEAPLLELHAEPVERREPREPPLAKDGWRGMELRAGWRQRY